MRIMVYGAGAVGSLFGGMLARTCEVHLVGREAHVRAVQSNGLRIRTQSDDLISHPSASTSVPRNARFDIAAIAVKTYDLEEACRALTRLDRLPDVILSLQNGLGNEEVMVEFFPRDRIARAIIYEGVTLRRPGLVERFGTGLTYLGRPFTPESNQSSLDSMADQLNSNQLPCKVSNHIRKEIWRKLIVNAAINPLGAVAAVPNGALIWSPSLRRALHTLVHECEQVAKGAADYEFDLVNQAETIARNTSDNRNSMLLDLASGRRTEIDFLNGRIVELARKYQIEVPLNQHLVDRIRRLEMTG